MTSEYQLVPTIGGAYDRGALRRSIVHIGVGGFHRAHLATYIDELCRSGETTWSIVGAGVLPGDDAIGAALSSQDYCYTLIVRGADRTTVSSVGSIIEYLHAWPDTGPLVTRIADPDTQIVSMTVTEGGYPVDDATGSFLSDSPNAAPDSAFGAIVNGLHRRMTDGVGPVTVLSCDNVIGNGEVARRSVVGCASAHHGSDLVDWVQDNVSFPNSMVDRITPATAPADRQWLLAEHGIDDAWPVVTEPFRQWVVEDRFAGDRPPLESLDVIVTDDVEPFELMKLRLLNAGHSALAYLSALIDVITVSDAMAVREISQFLRRFLDHEAKPALPPIPDMDLDAYVASLIERFSNPGIADQIERLCLDGTAKFPKFLLPTVAVQLQRGGPVECAALALAGWCEYLNGVSETGEPIRLARDPNLDAAVAAARASQSNPAAFLELRSVFGDLGRSEAFRTAFVDALEGLRHDGVRFSIAKLEAT